MNKYLICIFALLILAVSCKQSEELKLVKFTGPIQGTYYAVTYYDAESRNLQIDVEALLKGFDLTASMWVENSVISKINRNDTTVTPNDLFIDLFDKSKLVYENSEGAFDPTVGPLVNAWGFGFNDRMKIDQHIIDSVLPFIGFDKVKHENIGILKSDPRIQFDFNAIAQGYSVDLVGEFLEFRGITNYLIDIGGEVVAKGSKPKGESWKVGIEKPTDNAEYGEGLKAIVNLDNKAMATSGNYRKFYEEDGIRYSHTIDPKTGYPVQHSLLSVSILADDCATADAYATAFMVLGLENSKTLLNKSKGMEAYFIFSDEDRNIKTYFTKGFEKILVEELN